MFTDKEIRAILLHEHYHCRKYDPIKVLIVTILSEGFIYIPILKKMVQYYKIGQELQADRYTISEMDSSYEIGIVLLKWIKNNTHNNTHNTNLVGVSFIEAAIYYRIQQIIETPKEIQIPFVKLRWYMLLLMIDVFLLLILSGGCSKI
jgi:beta-lactamase regulating signal transducer with metallopeptidase domain